MKPPPLTACLACVGCLASTIVTPAAEAQDNKIRTIVTRGERVDLEGYLVKGQYTLFEFYAEWSTEWREMAPGIEAKVRSADNVVLRRINVRSWTSPVVRQHGIMAIPHYKLYDPDGKLLKAYSPAEAQRRDPGSGRSDRRAAGSASRRKPPKIHVPKVLTISARGERVDLKKHLAEGQYTLFEFYADW